MVHGGVENDLKNAEMEHVLVEDAATSSDFERELHDKTSYENHCSVDDAECSIQVPTLKAVGEIMHIR